MDKQVQRLFDNYHREDSLPPCLDIATGSQYLSEQEPFYKSVLILQS